MGISRRDFIKWTGSGLAAAQASAIGQTGGSERPNVLFIALDDLRPFLGAYGHPRAVTPHLNRLAARGMCFTRAYAPEAICNPSRTAILTGLRPDTTGVMHNRIGFRETTPDALTLPQHFRNHGYLTTCVGKLYHGRYPDPRSWSRDPALVRWSYRRPYHGYQLDENRERVRQRYEKLKDRYSGPGAWGASCGPPTEAADVPDTGYRDGHIAEAAVATLREIWNERFFLGVGFHLPHLPLTAPTKYWDLYDPSEMELAANPAPPENVPAVAWHPSFELRARMEVPKTGPIPDDLARTVKHGYLASASYVDAQVGKVLRELDELGLWDNTVVVLWADHGFHLGEQGMWAKATNLETSLRVPLIVSTPDDMARGQASDGLVGLIDMYPTLCELAGLPVPGAVEGQSFAALLRHPQTPSKRAVFGQFPCPALREWAAQPLPEAMRKELFPELLQETQDRVRADLPAGYDLDFCRKHLMGYTMRTRRYRLTRWVDSRTPQKKAIAVELYDYKNDPLETRNVARAQPEIVKDLTKMIQLVV